mmetsp:Transcript_21812/g.35482  ORF Transcript_21812/g.35482 Transcript_21812/m.35482 type:complete len:253 (-) Transcript_21812:543-1301(-)
MNTALWNSVEEVILANGLANAHNSHRKIPKEYTSAVRPYPRDSPTSGAMYRGVPHLSNRNPAGLLSSFSGRPTANPKSNILSTPAESKPTLSGFRSRKTIFLECRYSIASATECATSICPRVGPRRVHSGLSFQSAMRSYRVSLSRSRRMKYPSFMTNASVRLPEARPCNLMMCRWSRVASMAVSWTRSSAPMVNWSMSDRIPGRRHFRAKALWRSPFEGGNRVAVVTEAERADLLGLAGRRRLFGAGGVTE